MLFSAMLRTLEDILLAFCGYDVAFILINLLVIIGIYFTTALF